MTTIESKKIGVLGWSFKKNTNDSRESASIYVTNDLLGAKIQKKIISNKIKLFLLKSNIRYSRLL